MRAAAGTACGVVKKLMVPSADSKRTPIPISHLGSEALLNNRWQHELSKRRKYPEWRNEVKKPRKNWNS